MFLLVTQAFWVLIVRMCFFGVESGFIWNHWIGALHVNIDILPGNAARQWHSWSVSCRNLVIPGATAWLCASLPNYSIEQWRMTVIVTGYTLFVMSQYNAIFTFANQRFAEVCWHILHIILHALSSLVVQCVTVMNISYQRSKLGDRSKTQHSSQRQISS